MYSTPAKLTLIALLFNLQSVSAMTYEQHSSALQDEALHKPPVETGKQLRTEQTLREKVQKAITAFENTERSQWHFTLKKYENEEGDISSSIEQHNANPAGPNRWTLVQIDGEVPTEKQTQRYLKKKAEQRKKNKDKAKKEHSFSFRLKEIIKMETLQLIAESPETLQMGFQVNLSEFGEEASSKLQGHLYYDIAEQFIAVIEITNSESFSPMFSADITLLSLRLEFIKVNNAILPSKNRMDLQGTWAFFTEINEISEALFSDYIMADKPSNKASSELSD